MILGHHIGPTPQELPEYHDAGLFSVLKRLAEKWNKKQAEEFVGGGIV